MKIVFKKLVSLIFALLLTVPTFTLLIVYFTKATVANEFVASMVVLGAGMVMVFGFVAVFEAMFGMWKDVFKKEKKKCSTKQHTSQDIDHKI